MSETTPAPTPPAGQAMPPLAVNVQYVKDLSFEVPGAPAIFNTLRGQPAVNINLDVQVQPLDQQRGVFEVTLSVKAEATESPAPGTTNGAPANANPGATVFIAELVYAGVFTLTNIPQDSVEPVLLVECPRLLFPFARNILADVTREGGFIPVLLQPIDFVALWQARRMQQGQGMSTTV